MKFDEAVEELKKGNSIKRPQWTHSLSPAWLTHPGNVPITDALADDWELYEGPGKTFYEVFPDFKEGKIVRRKSWPKEGVFSEECKKDLLSNDWEVIEC